jgi:hypothetical protein
MLSNDWLAIFSEAILSYYNLESFGCYLSFLLITYSSLDVILYMIKKHSKTGVNLYVKGLAVFILGPNISLSTSKNSDVFIHKSHNLF